MKLAAKAARNNATSDLSDESSMHDRPSVAEVYQRILELSCIRRWHYGAVRFIGTHGHHDVFSYFTRQGKLVKCVIMHNGGGRQQGRGDALFLAALVPGQMPVFMCLSEPSLSLCLLLFLLVTPFHPSYSSSVSVLFFELLFWLVSEVRRTDS